MTSNVNVTVCDSKTKLLPLTLTLLLLHVIVAVNTVQSPDRKIAKICRLPMGSDNWSRDWLACTMIRFRS